MKNVLVNPSKYSKSKLKDKLVKLGIPQVVFKDCSLSDKENITKIEKYKDGTLMVLNLFETCEDFVIKTQHVAFWLGQDKLVAFGSLLVDNDFNESRTNALSGILDSSIRSLFKTIEKHEKHLVEIESIIMKKTANINLIKKLYSQKTFWERIALNIDLQEDLLDDLLKSIENFEEITILKDLHDQYVKAQRKVEKIISKINNLQNFSMSLMSNDTNDTMRFLSVVSTILLPMTAISGIFGMNFVEIPWADHPLGFYGLVVGMLIIAVGSIAYFKVKKWL